MVENIDDKIKVELKRERRSYKHKQPKEENIQQEKAPEEEKPKKTKEERTQYIKKVKELINNNNQIIINVQKGNIIICFDD